MKLFEVFEGDRLDHCVSAAFRTDFALKISDILLNADLQDPAVYAFAKQLRTAVKILRGHAKIGDHPELSDFELTEG